MAQAHMNDSARSVSGQVGIDHLVHTFTAALQLHDPARWMLLYTGCCVVGIRMYTSLDDQCNIAAASVSIAHCMLLDAGTSPILLQQVGE
eukprot:35577-Eustigmatos_ZCMA.PRE.1